MAVNTSRSSYCNYHVAEQYRRLQATTRPQFMDNNLASAFRGANKIAAREADRERQEALRRAEARGAMARLGAEEVAERANKQRGSVNGARWVVAEVECACEQCGSAKGVWADGRAERQTVLGGLVVGHVSKMCGLLNGTLCLDEWVTG